MKPYRLCLSVFFGLFCLWSGNADANPVCGDFLAMAGKKPPHLEYRDCVEGKQAQIRVLRARYRVAGKYAHLVEEYLVKETGMQPLSHVCCLWESMPKDGKRYGHLPHSQWPKGSPESIDPILTRYEISMGSGESLVSQRENWEAIDWFYVDVELFLELP